MGVIILILASIGIYYWVPEEIGVKAVGVNEFLGVTGNIKDRPESITVSENSPFYPLIVTPLAINYDENGEQTIIPLYVMNTENPSNAVLKIQNQIGVGKRNEIIKDDESAKNASLRIAKTYWENSDAALIIEDNKNGYSLGLIATPLASYLRIPVIVTDEVDTDVTNTLNDLNVKNTIILGENLDGFGNVLKFESVDDIINTSISLI